MGSLRGDFSIALPWNCIHGSDSTESSNREINHWFTQEEIVQWNSHSTSWVYEKCDDVPKAPAASTAPQEAPKAKKAPKPLPAEYIKKAVDDKVVAKEDQVEEKVDAAAVDDDFLGGFDAFDE